MTISEYFGRDIRLRHLKLLVALDDAGQLARVARLFNVTQPAVSKTLAEIERSIGAPLFERTPQGLIANHSGAMLIRAARNALAELERAGAEMRGFGGPGHTLVVGVMPSASLPCLSPAIALLAQRDPTLSVRVIDGQTAALFSQLVSDRLQLIVGARVRPMAPEGVESISLYDDPMLLVASPNHPLVRLAKPTWERCIAHPWVLPPIGNPLRASVDRSLRANRLAAPQQVIEGLSIELVLGLLEKTSALNLMPACLVAELEVRGLVKKVRSEHATRLDIFLPVTIFVNTRQRNERGIRALIDCLVQTAESRVTQAAVSLSK